MVSLALIEGFAQSARRVIPSKNTLEPGFGFGICVFIYLLTYLVQGSIFHHVWFTISLAQHLAKGDFRKGVSTVSSKEHNNEKILLCVSKWLNISRLQVRKVWWLFREIVLGTPQRLACDTSHRSITETVLKYVLQLLSIQDSCTVGLKRRTPWVLHHIFSH